MAGSPPQQDLFDYKPLLNKLHGQTAPKELYDGERFAFIKGDPTILGSPYDFARYGANGTWVSESLAIMEYLEELHPEPPMIGRDPLERARVREVERIAEWSVLRPIAQIVHATNSPLDIPPVPEMAEVLRKELPQGLGVLDRRLSDGRPFLMGERPTIADCTLAAGLQFGRFRGVEPDPGFEHLARWDHDYRERAPAKAVLVV